MIDRDETSFRLLQAIERQPGASQRDLARSTRASLGAVNYCLRALQEKGLVKVRNFQASDAKLRYVYILTPQGLAAKAQLTRRFLARKLEEYERLREEIEAMRRDVEEGHEPPLAAP